MLDAPRFVDLPPIQIYATLLDEGTYLCSISTLYRILAEHAQLVERRRIARHPARTVPELVATGPGPGVLLGHHQTRRAGQGRLLRRLRDDRHLLPLHRRRPGPPARVRAARGRHDAAGVRAARRPAGRARRPGHLDDLEDRRPAARRPRGHPVPLPAEGVERQPLLRGLVQNLEVRPDVPRTVRLPGRRAAVHGRFRRRLQPPPPPHRHRSAHPRRRPLRPRRRPSPSNAKRPSPPPAAATPNGSAPNRSPKIINLPGAVWINQPLQQAAA